MRQARIGFKTMVSIGLSLTLFACHRTEGDGTGSGREVGTPTWSLSDQFALPQGWVALVVDGFTILPVQSSTPVATVGTCVSLSGSCNEGVIIVRGNPIDPCASCAEEQFRLGDKLLTVRAHAGWEESPSQLHTVARGVRQIERSPVPTAFQREGGHTVFELSDGEDSVAAVTFCTIGLESKEGVGEGACRPLQLPPHGTSSQSWSCTWVVGPQVECVRRAGRIEVARVLDGMLSLAELDEIARRLS